MLKLVIGRSGSGKTHWILERMTELVHQGQEKIFWLVPEQHSFECERLLLQRLGPVQAAGVQVLSFSRLADRVFREVGGLAGQPLDDGARALLMSRALEQVVALTRDQGGEMQGLRSHLVTDSAYVEHLLSLWKELRRCAVTTAMLEEVAEKLMESEGEHALLTEKTQDLCRVYSVYEGLVKSVGLREADDLTRLAEVLSTSTLLQGAAVFVDGFKGFTQQEQAVLKALLPQVGEIAVALCTDTPGKKWPQGEKPENYQREYPLFAPVTATIRRLCRMTEQPWELVRLEENHRAKTPALKLLEAGLYHPKPQVHTEKTDDVMVTPCATVYEECRYAVRQIRRLLREGYRCREIAVAVRNLESYQGILDDMLSCDGIPYYMDLRRDLLCEPLVVYLRCALRLAVGGWRTEELLRLLKTDLWSLSPVEIAEMENYVYTWRIEGNAWAQEWTENPGGMDSEMDEQQQALLAKLNGYRQALMDSLGALRQDLRGEVTGRQFALAVYRWLQSQEGLPERIAKQTKVLETMAQPVLAAHAARLWDEMMKVLDRFAMTLGDQRIKATRLEEWFTMLCRTIDMGTIPQGLDSVQVGSIERMRFNAPRAVLVLGANEGVLPAYPSGDGLLTEDERERLKALKLPLAEDVLTQCVEERYYAYQALTAASEQVIVTYQTAGKVGPSPVVTAIKTIFPENKEQEANAADGSDLESAEEMFRCLAQSYSAPSKATATLEEALKGLPEQQNRLAAVKRSADRGMNYRIDDPATAQALFKKDMCLSATQADTFYNCKFQYFCKFGLRLTERRVAEIDGGVFGVLVHHAMEVLLKRYCQPGDRVETLRKKETNSTTPDPALMAELRADVEQELKKYVNKKLGGFANKNGRFHHQFGLAVRSSVNVLWHTLVELQQGDFTPQSFELSIKPVNKEAPKPLKENCIPSLNLPLSEGSVQVSGKVDRVDLYLQGDTVYVRVVDYKTGSTTFMPAQLAAGQNIQMLLYLFTILDSNLYGEKMMPAGVLYHPVTDLVVNKNDNAGSRLKRMKMSGVVLDDMDVLQAMEKEGQGVFIPASIKQPSKSSKDKTLTTKGNVVTLAQFQLLRRLVERLLVQMGESLLAGDVEALPTQHGERSHCEYCKFKAICAHEPEHGFNKLSEATSLAPALEKLEQEVAADE